MKLIRASLKKRRKLLPFTLGYFREKRYDSSCMSHSFRVHMFICCKTQVNLNNFITQLRNRFVDEKTDTFDWSALGYESAGLWRRVPRCTILYVKNESRLIVCLNLCV